jgi:uncharacterized protein (DUF1684 family)
VASRIASFRQHKDEYFADGDHSPIPEEELEGFTGLDYFDENPELAFELTIDEDAPGTDTRIVLDTSDGETIEFLRAGRITFVVGETAVSLTVLKDLDRGRYFLPFTDKTTGDTTYEGGRYLDPQMNRSGLLSVDFNYAYNPYCAYDEGWSCPLPPDENMLDVAIEAGERKYLPVESGKHHHHVFE